MFTSEKTYRDMKEFWHFPSDIPFYGLEIEKAASKHKAEITGSFFMLFGPCILK
jgi:hypothetical protein